MPRALTEREKCVQCQRLLDKGKAVVLSQGMRKVSVDEIAKAAGMAKGSFYQHFESKEQYFIRLIKYIHEQIFIQAEQIVQSGSNLRENTRDFLRRLFHMPEMMFFTKNYHYINDLFVSMPDIESQSAKQMEADMFEKLLRLAGIDTLKVKPGVVNNYVHTMYLMMGSDIMMKNDLPETFECIMDSLISYIFGDKG